MTKKNILDYLSSHKIEYKEKFGVEEIGLFGSYARNEATDKSDIDIFVKMPPKLFNMIAIKQKIAEDLSVSVDIVRLRERMNQTLKARILNEGVSV